MAEETKQLCDPMAAALASATSEEDARADSTPGRALEQGLGDIEKTAEPRLAELLQIGAVLSLASQPLRATLAHAEIAAPGILFWVECPPHN